jgi:hypothetical protein
MNNTVRISAISLVAALVAALLGPALSPLCAQSIPGAVLAQHEPHHHVAYADATMRVLRVHVPPHDTTLLHEHGPDYFWIALGASEVVNARLGAPDATIKSSDVSVHYTPGKFAHVARNPGSTSFDNITIELLQPQSNVRNACEPALGGQPVHCTRPSGPATGLTAGTEHPAFSTDRLRVSVLTLGPGEKMRPRIARERWIIALDTADTRSALTTTGQARWMGGVLHSSGKGLTVRNGSTRDIRFLLAERR